MTISIVSPGCITGASSNKRMTPESMDEFANGFGVFKKSIRGITRTADPVGDTFIHGTNLLQMLLNLSHAYFL